MPSDDDRTGAGWPAVAARRAAQEERHTAERTAAALAETKAAAAEGIDPVLVAATLRTLLAVLDADRAPGPVALTAAGTRP
ncbi:hypothetical protein OG322_34080 [Streptomyces sp. NBC_01260]|uniref:hypothetical protein n=1 Tax=unclassified Streptomyces TaxID=2593676 RepID=UPI000FB7C230|nr:MULTISPECIES: hypothetical protein [unclassified Streptomyces]MCX4774283.1 hypothetical protein [Streptomyces sp. NBC_01285]ROQ73255.1 hypothetical protein EDD95_5911 [Streptomyces sp. CEV 2-1]RPK36378.1 hypothetical protein EES39_31950 [Streptomyces sp. ADI92-24]